MKYILTNLTILLVFTIIFCSASSVSMAQKPVSKQDKAAIEKIVREYLLKNPIVVRDAMQALAAQEEAEKQQKAAKNLTTFKSDIYSDAGSPVAGNPKGDVTVVVFFDYNCGYCKSTLPGLEALLKKDPMIRVIYKEFPILGPQSQTAAQAAMAAGRQGKYIEFHNALFAAESADENSIKNISNKLGLDYTKLQSDMTSLKINESLARNLQLATALNIEGTPAYIVGNMVIPGAIDADSLGKIVIQQRTKLNAPKTTNGTVEP